MWGVIVELCACVCMHVCMYACQAIELCEDAFAKEQQVGSPWVFHIIHDSHWRRGGNSPHGDFTPGCYNLGGPRLIV